jgi:transcriptional regulator with XRE-family HTH domain
MDGALERYVELQATGGVRMAASRRSRNCFAARLLSLRCRTCLSGPELARRAGLSADTIQSLEQGRADNPTVTTVFALARALDVPHSVLFDALAEDWDGLREPTTAGGSVGDESLGSP